MLKSPCLSLLAIALAAAAALPAQAHIVTYTAALSGLAEVPANTSPGVGNVTVTVDDHFFTMRVQATFSGLLGITTAAHIHCCTTVPGATNAGVATVTPSFTDFPLGVTFGIYDFTYDMTAAVGSWNNAFVAANGGTRALAFNALLAGLNSGNAYFNLHTASFTGGELRGNLAFSSMVPEPGTLTLVVAALGLAGVCLRRRA